MFKIIDDFLPENYADQLSKDWRNFQWFYSPYTSKQVKGKPITFVVDDNTYDYGQFECIVKTSLSGIKPNLDYSDFIKPIYDIAQTHIDKQILSVRRVKFNLMLQQPHAPDGHYNRPHKDTNLSNHYSMVYYVDDSDGDTFLFNEFWTGEVPDKLTVFNRVSPKKNRAVIFDSNRFHASSNPRVNKERVVINFVLNVQ